MFELHIPWWETFGRLLLAAFLGAILGWDREAHSKPAGMRTFMMVALGATGISLIANAMFEMLRHDTELYRGVDPTRLLEGIIGGIGFIGAGTIIRGQGHVEGITTAAGIWLTAAVGIAVGLGNYTLAITLTALALLVLMGAGYLTARPREDEASDDK